MQSFKSLVVALLVVSVVVAALGDDVQPNNNPMNQLMDPRNFGRQQFNGMGGMGGPPMGGNYMGPIFGGPPPMGPFGKGGRGPRGPKGRRGPPCLPFLNPQQMEQLKRLLDMLSNNQTNINDLIPNNNQQPNNDQPSDNSLTTPSNIPAELNNQEAPKAK